MALDCAVHHLTSNAYPGAAIIHCFLCQRFLLYDCMLMHAGIAWVSFGTFLAAKLFAGSKHKHAGAQVASVGVP